MKKSGPMRLAICVIFPSLMAFAALSDLFTMTISNRLSLALLVLFLPFAALAGLSPAEIGLHLACGLAVLTLTFAFFAFGWIGGGDAKLAAATAVWMGFAHVGEYGLQAAMLGGILTVLILIARRYPLPGWSLGVEWITRLHDRESGIPYGIALAIAAVMLYPETAVWTALTSA